MTSHDMTSPEHGTLSIRIDRSIVVGRLVIERHGVSRLLRLVCH